MTDTSAAARAAAPADRWEDNAAFWVQIIQERRDRYRTELTDEAVLEAIGDCRGLEVLDAGCGEGYLAREIARRGARQVTGIDKSRGLIEAARAGDMALAVRFDQADVAALPFSGASFDLAVASHLFNDLSDSDGPISELARVLRPGGRLVTLMLHPCFYGHRDERQAIRRTLPVAEYFSARVVEQHFEVDGITSPASTTTWVRPLEAYTDAMTGNGLCITKLAEPHPSAAQLAGSAWWRDNFPRPLFLLISARKDS